MHDFPEEEIPGQPTPGQPTPGRITPEQLRQFTLDLGIELTDDEAGKFTAIIEAIQGAEAGGSIGDTGFTGSIDVPTRVPPLSEMGVGSRGLDTPAERNFQNNLIGIEEQDRLVGSEAFPRIKALGIGARGIDTPDRDSMLQELLKRRPGYQGLGY